MNAHRLLVVGLALILSACPEPSQPTTPPIDKAPSDPEPKPVAKKDPPPSSSPTAAPGSRKAPNGWYLYSRLELELKDWRFGLVEVKDPMPPPVEIEKMMKVVGATAAAEELKTLAAGQKVEVVVVPSKVWDYTGLIKDAHDAIVEGAKVAKVELTIPSMVVPGAGLAELQGEFEVVCMSARTSKSEAEFAKSTRDKIRHVRAVKAFREAQELPVERRAAFMYAVAKEEAKRRWRCPAMEKHWPPDAEARQKIADLDKAPASMPASKPALSPKHSQPKQPASAPSK